MKALVQGDVVVVVKLDRLARSTSDLLNIIHDLQQKGWFVSLGEAWCDTESDVGQLMVTAMTGIAQFERQLIRKRCEEGIARAKAMGKRFGRHPALDSDQRRKVAQLHAKGATVRDLAEEYQVGVATIMRALQWNAPCMAERRPLVSQIAGAARGRGTKDALEFVSQRLGPALLPPNERVKNRERRAKA
jgi:DNA invertase Pin-like site-specific DNA recombinase